MTRLTVGLLLLLAAVFPAAAEDAWTLASGYAGEALARNPELQAAEQDVRYAEAKSREAFGGMLPSIRASSRYSRADGGREIRFDINDFLPPDILSRDLPPSVIPFIRETEQVTRVELTQPLFNAGVFYYFKVQEYGEEAVREGFAAERTSLVADVRKAYFEAARAREMVAVAEAELTSSERQLADVRSRQTAGTAPPGDLQRALAARAGAVARLSGDKARADLAIRELNRLRGAALGTPVLWPDSVGWDSAGPAPLDSLTLQALATRAELRRLDNAVQSLKAAEKTALSQYLPTLTAAAEYGFQGADYEFDDRSDYYIVSGVLSWDLFSGFRRDAQRQQATSERRKLERQRTAAEAGIRQQVAAARLTWEAHRDQLAAAREARAAADEALRMVEALYREGMTGQADLTDARAQRRDAAAGEIAARYGMLIARADLWASLGKTFDHGEESR